MRLPVPLVGRFCAKAPQLTFQRTAISWLAHDLTSIRPVVCAATRRPATTSSAELLEPDRRYRHGHFDERVEFLRRFVEENGRHPKRHEKQDGERIGTWFSSLGRSTELTPDRLEQLRAVLLDDGYQVLVDRLEGMTMEDRRFATMAKILGRFVAKHGRAPIRHEVFEDEPVGRWLTICRHVKLSPAREALLVEEMGDFYAASFRPEFVDVLDAVVAFHREHGALPTQNFVHEDLLEQTEVRRLAVWLSQRRREVRGGAAASLSAEHERLLDERLPGWRPEFASQEARWEARLAEAVSWVKSNGGWPSKVNDFELDVEQWIYRQRHQLRRRRLSERRIAMLDAALEGWRPEELRDAHPDDLAPRLTQNEVDREAEWAATLQLSREFYARHGRLPVDVRKSSALSTEQRLFTWLSNQRAWAAAGRMSAQHERKLDAELPAWRTREGTGRQQQSWHDGLERLVRFRASHRRLPKYLERDGEGFAIGYWLHNQRHARRVGKLVLERSAALDVAIPGWHVLVAADDLIDADRAAACNT